MKRVYLVTLMILGGIPLFFLDSLQEEQVHEFPDTFVRVETIDENEENLIEEDRAPANVFSRKNISSGRGRRRTRVRGASTNHKGTDYRSPCGTPVRARRGGPVKMTGYRSRFGIMVAIGVSPGCREIYAHLSRKMVGMGQKVRAGQLIGLVGSTGVSGGCHLHHEGCSNLYAERDLEELIRTTELIEKSSEPKDGESGTVTF